MTTAISGRKKKRQNAITGKKNRKAKKMKIAECCHYSLLSRMYMFIFKVCNSRQQTVSSFYSMGRQEDTMVLIYNFSVFYYENNAKNKHWGKGGGQKVEINAHSGSFTLWKGAGSGRVMFRQQVPDLLIQFRRQPWGAVR